MKVTFERSKCHMLQINHLTEPNFQGNFMSPQDLKDTENFVKDLIFKGILPTMERNVLTLNEFVSFIEFFWVLSTHRTHIDM